MGDWETAHRHRCAPEELSDSDLVAVPLPLVWRGHNGEHGRLSASLHRALRLQNFGAVHYYPGVTLGEDVHARSPR